MSKLNIGCGQNKLPGFVNVDKYASCSPDIVWDCEQTPWPFETGSITEVCFNHSLEHMGATADVFFGIMKELYRVVTPTAGIAINVPHPRSDAFMGDPTHVRIITPMVLSLFSKKNNQKWKESGEPNSPLAMYIDVDFEILHIQYNLTPHWREKLDKGQIDRAELNYAAITHNNVVDEIQMVIKAIK